MPETEKLGSFFSDIKNLSKEYAETRLEIYRLRLIRLLSKSAGYFVWTLISLMLALLFAVFLGLTTGFWLSALTGSYTQGFGITTLIILVIIGLLALLRKTLFVNPIIRNMIRRTTPEPGPQED